MVTVKAKTMFPRGVAVFAITRQGVQTASKITEVLSKQNINCKTFAAKKYARNNVIALDKKLGASVRDVFGDVDAIVAVMATGVIVRAVAPLLKTKMSDPAVVSVDVSGLFAVSLLSGHYGGANELTKLIAEGLGAVPVVTTASDVLGKVSVDELARKLHCTVVNPESLVAVNSALVNSERLVLVLAENVNFSVSELVDYEVRAVKNVEEAIDVVSSFDAGTIITHEKVLHGKTGKPVTVLKPQTIAVGVGSRKFVSEDDIVELVTCALKQVKIPLERVDRLVTVDIKKDSPSMLNAAKELGKSLEFVSIEELGSFRHEDLSADSKLVRQKIGVGGVCEQVALIVAGKKAKLVLKKTKAKGVTVAVAKGE